MLCELKKAVKKNQKRQELMGDQYIPVWKATSKVGIFWAYQGKIIAGTTLFTNAVDDGLFVNSPHSHVDFWETVREKYPELQMFEYEEIPRGRILFSKEEDMFFIYMDKVLFNENFKRQILEEFELSQLNETKFKFMIDAHYTTDKKEIELLLDKV